jgi:hypothetical protein
MKPMLKIAAVGIAVASNMLGVTLSGLIYTPLLYVVIHGLTERFGSHAHRSGTGEPLQ